MSLKKDLVKKLDPDTLDPLLKYLADFGKKHGIQRTKVCVGDLSLEIELPSTPLPPVEPIRTTPSTESADDDVELAESNPNIKVIRSPLVGTYYQASSPEADPFISVGDTIKKGHIIGIIEAMKLFNEIESEYSGRITQILVKNEMPVEYNQPLILMTTE